MARKDNEENVKYEWNHPEEDSQEHMAGLFRKTYIANGGILEVTCGKCFIMQPLFQEGF